MKIFDNILLFKISKKIYSCIVPNPVYGFFLLCREHGVRIENFDPVTVGIFDESNSLHAAVVWFLHKVDALFFKALTCGINVWHQNSNMTKTSWFRVSVMIYLIRIRLTAPITKQKYRQMLISLQTDYIQVILLCQFYCSLLAHSPT